MPSDNGQKAPRSVVLLGMGKQFGPEVLGLLDHWRIPPSLGSWNPLFRVGSSFHKALIPTTLFIVASKSGGTSEVMSICTFGRLHRTPALEPAAFHCHHEPGTGGTLGRAAILGSSQSTGYRRAVLGPLVFASPAALIALKLRAPVERPALRPCLPPHTPLDEIPASSEANDGNLAKAGGIRSPSAPRTRSNIRTRGNKCGRGTGKAARDSSQSPMNTECHTDCLRSNGDRYRRLKGTRMDARPQVAALAQHDIRS